MVGCETISRSMHHIQPIWSSSHAEARTRVIKLYKSWFREIPHIGNLKRKKGLLLLAADAICFSDFNFFFFFIFPLNVPVDDYNLPLTVHQCRNKLHGNFSKQKNLSDIRQIDTLVLKHQQELKELRFRQMDRSHLMKMLENESNNGGGENTKSHRTQFLDKFLVGQN